MKKRLMKPLYGMYIWTNLFNSSVSQLVFYKQYRLLNLCESNFGSLI